MLFIFYPPAAPKHQEGDEWYKPKNDRGIWFKEDASKIIYSQKLQRWAIVGRTKEKKSQTLYLAYAPGDEKSHASCSKADLAACKWWTQNNPEDKPKVKWDDD